MKEHYFPYGQGYSYLRYAELKPERKTLLFMHGIGDSSLSYIPYLLAPELNQFNVLAIDFLGYGKSSQQQTYPIESQVDAVVAHLTSLERQINFPLDNIVLIPHSIASIHAMMICESQLKPKIHSVISVEGSVTQYGTFITDAVSKLVYLAEFGEWFQNFKEVDVFNHFLTKFPRCHSYYASLCFCDPKAFLQNALEVKKICTIGSGKYTNLAGSAFANLSIPKVYCYGDKSLCQESIDFLHENTIPTQVFHTNNHFIMQECFNEFVKFIVEFAE